jgi:hypothetical protein
MARRTHNETSPVAIESLRGWIELGKKEQEQVRAETLALADAFMTGERSKMEMGQHFVAIRQILEPKRLFVKYLQWFRKQAKRKVSQASIYRYMELFEKNQSLPHPVLEIALSHGYDRIDPVALEKNPPPRTQDTQRIIEYLDSVQKKDKRGRPPKDAKPTIEYMPPEGSTDLMLKECMNFISIRLDKLPRHHKTRQAFLDSLVGMILTRLGISSAQSFAPMAITAGFVPSKSKSKVA